MDFCSYEMGIRWELQGLIHTQGFDQPHGTVCAWSTFALTITIIILTTCSSLFRKSLSLSGPAFPCLENEGHGIENNLQKLSTLRNWFHDYMTNELILAGEEVIVGGECWKRHRILPLLGRVTWCWSMKSATSPRTHAWASAHASRGSSALRVYFQDGGSRDNSSWTRLLSPVLSDLTKSSPLDEIL